MIRWLLNRMRGPARGEAARPRNAYCSFCRRSHTAVGPLVEGPDLVFICGECIILSGEMLAQERARRE